MSDISKAYEPKAVEEKWYAAWEAAGSFHGDENSDREGYSIVIPPPNVTGVLHIGHVLNNTLQDILARRARMDGKEVMWLPGSDHAGIATQTVVERQLRKEEKKTRHDLGREKFLERVWAWKEKHGNIIFRQLKKLGCSCDWERERFTMDEGYSQRVSEVFVDLYKKGMIYRGKRMVNWCPVSLTALSDEEVIPKAQKGFLYHLRYEVVEMPGTYLEIATTRPETIMGDTAVAVHPEDPRYKHLVGKHCRRPLPVENQAAIPIIADAHIDMEFGTGVLKVTPAHDKADYEIGERHQLEIIDVLNPDGTLNELAGAEFAGMDRFDARKRAAEVLGELGALVKEEPYENNVGFSERADVPIEPRLSEQWFLRYPKVEEARRVVQENRIRFFPERWEKVYDHWMENIQDWCISRQLWWGHRIPVWYRGEEMRCQVESPGEDWVQDSDVLDTWFSSWLWPFATMDEATLKKFYPTSVLVTGWDILFFWVARMIMAGLEYREEVPFRDVYFTGMIRDKQGRKMSKSLGNSPDPLDLIAKYGADGLRFGLLRIAPQGADIRFDEKQIEEGRNFGSKLWNAARFRQMQGASASTPSLEGLELSEISIDLVHKLDQLVEDVTRAYQEYRFNEICQRMYEFFWSEYCDWYVEAAKASIYGEDSARKTETLAVMDVVLSVVLRLLHPFMPHITEELWERLGFQVDTRGKGFLMFAQWPGASMPNGVSAEMAAKAAKRVGAVYAAVRQARNLRAEYGIPSNRKVKFILKSMGEELPDLAVFTILSQAEEVSVEPDFEPERGVPGVATPIGRVYLPLQGLVDVDAERERIQKEIGKVEAELEKVKKKLSNENFVKNAPEEVVAEHRGRVEAFTARYEQLRQMQDALG